MVTQRGQLLWLRIVWVTGVEDGIDRPDPDMTICRRGKLSVTAMKDEEDELGGEGPLPPAAVARRTPSGDV